MRLEIVCTPFGVATLVAIAVACSDTQGSLDPRSVDHLASSDWRSEQRLEASDAAEFDQLGYSVSLTDDRALVGAFGEASYAGAAYLFVRNGASFSEEQKLVVSDGAPYDYFGWSVALDGDHALIGAYAEDDARGAAYVFVRDGNSWTEEQKLIASDGTEGDNFGWAVALVANRALIAAYANDVARGAAYVFVRDGNSWIEEQKLVATDGDPDDLLAYSASLGVDRAVLGAPGKDGSRGAAYVFVRSGSSWSEERKLVASDGESDDLLGCSVALDADSALLGAYRDATFRGAAYTFVRSDGSWTEEQKLVASDGADGHRFGNSVSLASDRALIGAHATDNGRGAAYVFVRSDGSWNEEQKLVASDGAASDLFGWSVSLADERALIGAYYDDNLRGAAYVFSHIDDGAALGAPCTSRGQCASGHCADGVCCDVICDGTCEACTAALKGDERDGTCAAVTAGVDAACDGALEASAPDGGSGCACRASRARRRAPSSWLGSALGLLLLRRGRTRRVLTHARISSREKLLNPSRGDIYDLLTKAYFRG